MRENQEMEWDGGEEGEKGEVGGVITENSPSEKQLVKKSSRQPFTPSKIRPQFPIEVTATITHPVAILGRKGFSPPELTIEAGDSVTWTNIDPQGKIVVLTLQQKNTWNSLTSPALRPGEEWDHVFTESTEYSYWAVGYGVKGRLVVKESNS